MLFECFATFGDKTALVEEDGHRVSYAQLEAQISKFSEELPSERQLIFMIVENTLTSIICYLSCLRARHPVLLLSGKNTESNSRIISNYKPNAIIDTRNNEIHIEWASKTPIALHEDLAILLSTSGSTGSPKLVKLSKANITSNTSSIIEYLKLTSSDIAITSMDINYSYGMSIVNTHLSCGATIVLTEKSPLNKEFWSLVDKFGVTSFSGVPYNFETLHSESFDVAKHPSLRYMTQAGGKLSAKLVRHFALEGASCDVEFYVMYGQTEASPRISYLPPEFCIRFPNSIGIPVPRGEFALVDETNEFIVDLDTEGELVYRGPNVMMGYAKDNSELSIKEDIEWLHTGDIAKFNSEKLAIISGRKSRFVKPFGIRISLDDIENFLTDGGQECAVVNEKDRVVVVIERDSIDEERLLQRLSERFLIPSTSFTVHKVEQLERLSNGKLNYKGILKELQNLQSKFTFKIRRFFGLLADEIKNNIGLKTNNWDNILAVYSFYFPSSHVSLDASFNSLSGDSLLYVTISLELEEVLHFLPNDWMELSIFELERLREKTL